MTTLYCVDWGLMELQNPQDMYKEVISQLIQSWLQGIGNAGFHRYGMPDSYMSDNYLFCLLE
eukprot:scaffold33003_cov53-Attheya_sp.AAC.1